MAGHEQTARAVHTALQQARTDLEYVQGERRDLVERVAATDEEITRLEQAVSRLGDLAAAFDHQAAPASQAPANKQPPRSSRPRRESRTKAVLRILEGAEEALSAAEITRRLNAEGRNDIRKQVRNALSNLAGKQWASHDRDAGGWLRV